jgi:hypothetical protein
VGVQELLRAPLEAATRVCPSFNESLYQTDSQRLLQQELPYFRAIGLCGHCGDSTDMSNASYFDFISYIQYKALLKQVPAQAWCALRCAGIVTYCTYDMKCAQSTCAKHAAQLSSVWVDIDCQVFR